MKVSEPPVVVEQHFNTSIDTVWNAITELTQMKRWFFENIPNFKPIVGFQTEFSVTNENRLFTHLWKITEVIPKEKLVYNWKYREYPGDSYVEFDVTKEENQAKLRVTATVIEDFPDDIPEFKWQSCRDGWTYFIKDRLQNYLSEIEESK